MQKATLVKCTRCEAPIRMSNAERAHDGAARLTKPEKAAWLAPFCEHPYDIAKEDATNFV